MKITRKSKCMREKWFSETPSDRINNRRCDILIWHSSDQHMWFDDFRPIRTFQHSFICMSFVCFFMYWPVEQAEAIALAVAVWIWDWKALAWLTAIAWPQLLVASANDCDTADATAVATPVAEEEASAQPPPSPAATQHNRNIIHTIQERIQTVKSCKNWHVYMWNPCDICGSVFVCKISRFRGF